MSDYISEKNSGTSSAPDNSHLLDGFLYPEDSYHNGVYWADLPTAERHSFVNKQSNDEAYRELVSIGREFKRDPLAPFGQYMRKYVVKGMGLFVEGYVLFSIGNLSPLFGKVWPECWKTYEVCNHRLIDSVNYLEICGIIIGQVLVGIEGDWIGRRFGLLQDALVMLIGVIMLTAIWGVSLQGWVAAYTVSLFIYGIGVGGEYPMTSASTLEIGLTGVAGARDDRMHRGRNVVLSFLMQGWGQIFNQCVLMILLLIFHGGTEPPYNAKLAQYTYRVSFGIIAVLHLWLLYYRYFHLRFADATVRQAKKRLNTSGYDITSLKLIVHHYWHRLMATAGGWFCNDFFFYGNKIFSSVFIAVIHPGASVFVTWEYNLLNCAVSLCGYYLAAFLIDHKFYGRKTMQQVGFFFDFIFFLFGAIFFKKLQEPGSHIKVFQWMYFMSGFFNQFGPNCVSFLVAAEVFPASIRATAHGFSAASGKLGALAPTILYNYIDNQTKFWVVPWFGLGGALLTWAFLPDTTGLDLREQERYWQCVRNGRADSYHGVAIHTRHLSWYEIHVLKRHTAYNPDLDRVAKLDELRVLYESYLIAKTDETGEYDDIDHAFISPEVREYFANEASVDSHINEQAKKEAAIKHEKPDVVIPSKLEGELN